MIKTNIKILCDALAHYGLKKEANRVAFLYVMANYDEQWRRRIDNLTREKKYPFAHWFPAGKNSVKLEFKRESVESDDSIESILNDLGYSITDYIGGYASDKSGRTYRIGKILNKKINEFKKLEMASDSAGDIQDLKILIQDIEEALITFNNDPDRISKDKRNLEIIISQDPHDIAQASFERNWESCFNLDSGSHRESIFCEVKDGGLVAYLVEDSDDRIENPLARLLIRRFENKDGQSYALAEDYVYGEDVSGFKEAVNAWLERKNAEMKPGRYTRHGGEYSDTFDEHEIIPPKELSKIKDWLQKDIPDDPNLSTWAVSDLYYNVLGEYGFWDDYDPFSESINNNEADIYGGWVSAYNDGTKVFKTELEANNFLDSLKRYDNPEEYTKIMLKYDGYDSDEIAEMDVFDLLNKYEELSEGRFKITRNDKDLTSKYQDVAFKKGMSHKDDLPPDVILAMKEYIDKKYPDSRAGDRNRVNFYINFPQFLTGKDFIDMKSYRSPDILKSIEPDKVDEFLDLANKNLEETLSMDSPTINIGVMDDLHLKTLHNSREQAISEAIVSNIRVAITDGMVYFPDNYLPPLKKLEEFFKEMSASDKLTKHDKAIVAKNIFFAAIKKSKDKNIIKRFIDLIMPYYDKGNFNTTSDSPNLYTVYKLIIKIGTLGRDYLPVFKEQLANLDKYINEYYLSRKNTHILLNDLKAISKDAKKNLEAVIRALSEADK